MKYIYGKNIKGKYGHILKCGKKCRNQLGGECNFKRCIGISK